MPARSIHVVCGMQSIESDGGSGRNFQQLVLSWSGKTSESLTQLGSFSSKSEKTQLNLAETKKANITENSLKYKCYLCSFSLSALFSMALVLFQAWLPS